MAENGSAGIRRENGEERSLRSDARRRSVQLEDGNTVINSQERWTGQRRRPHSEDRTRRGESSPHRTRPSTPPPAYVSLSPPRGQRNHHQRDGEQRERSLSRESRSPPERRTYRRRDRRGYERGRNEQEYDSEQVSYYEERMEDVRGGEFWARGY